MVTIDYYSRFFEVDRLMTKSAKEVIKKLKAHLARHGIPDQLVSDNRQPFASASFQEFADTYNFEHVTSSLTYPQSNGKVENAVKTEKTLLEKARKSESGAARLEEHPYRGGYSLGEPRLCFQHPSDY